MAMPDSVGTAVCGNCSREVFVRKNSGGFAYYRCEGCGVSMQHHIHRHSDAYMKSRVKLEAQPEAEPAKKPQKAVIPETTKPAARELSAAEKFMLGV